MTIAYIFGAAIVGVVVSGSPSAAETLTTHRLPSALAVEAASEAIAACARQGFHETAVVVDADGVTIVTLRGDGTGAHSLDSAYDKAYTAASFKNDTLALAERAKGEDSIAPLSKLPMSCSSAAALLSNSQMRPLARSAPRAPQGPNWMMVAPAPASRKFAIVWNSAACARTVLLPSNRAIL
jgi:uncharacterized protein GlcG (DUF336 family)